VAQRNRRRPRVVWLPNTNVNSLDQATNSAGYHIFIHNLLGVVAGAQVTSVTPVVIDDVQNPISATNSLSDIENSGYRLRRIVGKIFVAAHQVAGDTPSAAIVTCGYIVLRVDPLTNLPLQNAGFYQLGAIDNWGDPWIWRRSWIVANTAATNAPTQPFAIGAANSTNYRVGGNADGPHVDAKTARIISAEERLFLVSTSTVIGSQTDDQGPSMDISFLEDVRCLASMRTSSGNRRNASR